MNEAEVQRQIEQMVRFIKQEAEEKANEIRVSAEEEFNLEKLQLLEQEKARIRKEYERREAQVDVKKMIDQSKALNESRLRLLAAREEAMQQVLRETRAAVRARVADAPTYSSLLQALLVQALARLEEPESGSAMVRCRASDAEAVKVVLEPARKAYAKWAAAASGGGGGDKAGKASGKGGGAPQLVIDAAHPLPPAAAPGLEDDSPEGATCAGGVSVASTGGRVVCANTLDARVRVAYEALLPAIRSALFGDAI